MPIASGKPKNFAEGPKSPTSPLRTSIIRNWGCRSSILCKKESLALGMLLGAYRSFILAMDVDLAARTESFCSVIWYSQEILTVDNASSSKSDNTANKISSIIISHVGSSVQNANEVDWARHITRPYTRVLLRPRTKSTSRIVSTTEPCPTSGTVSYKLFVTLQDVERAWKRTYPMPGQNMAHLAWRPLSKSSDIEYLLYYSRILIKQYPLLHSRMAQRSRILSWTLFIYQTIVRKLL